MKTLVFLSVIAFAYAAADYDYYNLEKLEMDKLAKNKEELKKFIDCLLDRGECSKIHGTYKAVTADAVEQLCKRCSPYQKHAFWLFLQGVIAAYPKDYDNFKQKYDPSNKYFDTLESELRKYSIEY